MTPLPDYWAAAATVIPVLAAALVIEVRGLKATISADGNSFIFAYIHIQSAIVLGCLGVAEVVCFRALRTPNFSANWTAIVEISVTACMGSLVFTPALVFLFTGALTAWLGARIRHLKLRNHLADRRINRLEGRFNTLREERASQLTTLKTATDTATKQLRLLESAIADKGSNLDYVRLNDLFRLHDKWINHLARVTDIIEKAKSLPEVKLERPAELDSGTVDETPSGSLDYRTFDPKFREVP